MQKNTKHNAESTLNMFSMFLHFPWSLRILPKFLGVDKLFSAYNLTIESKRLPILKWCFLLMILAWVGCSEQASHETLTKEQSTLLNYLYNKSLISDTFSRTVYGMEIDCRGLDVEQQLLYFIFKRDIGRAKGIQAVSKDTHLVEFAPCETGPCNFGGLEGDITGYYAFRIPVHNLKVPENKNFKCALNSMPYEISFTDMVRACDSGAFYNTTKHFILTRKTKAYASNIGSYISKKGKDPIIETLSKKLLVGKQTNEEKAQALCDFVANEIFYSYEDFWYNEEITKRAHEVLLSGIGDCSGKSTLLASLLESAGIPYCLLYFNGHMNVGVAGDFPEENKMWYTLGKTRYYYAESTLPGFQIGKTPIKVTDQIREIYYYQIPQEKKYIYDALTLKPLEFITDEKLEELY